MPGGPTDFPLGLGDIHYEYDYFSGSNVLVYFEDVLVDDCVRIAWSVQQNRTPVYGYASQYFNALGAGVILVTGSFFIAFKEAYYIPLILNYIALTSSETVPYATPALSPARGMRHATSLEESSSEWQGEGLEASGARTAGRVQRMNIERLVHRTARNPEDPQVQAEMQQLALQLDALSDQEFEDVAEDFEDALWYGANENGGGRADTLSGNQTAAVESERLLAVRRADQFPPFDIIVTFGDMNTPGANHTLHRIMDVSIINTEFGGVEPTGEPIYVRYDFLARNLA